MPAWDDPAPRQLGLFDPRPASRPAAAALTLPRAEPHEHYPDNRWRPCGDCPDNERCCAGRRCDIFGY